jgi:transposase
MKTNIIPQKTLKPSATIFDAFVCQLKNNESVMFIATILLIARSTAYSWAKRIKANGLKPAQPKKRGRPNGSGRLLTPAQEGKIQNLITTSLPFDHGINFSVWSRRAVVELVYKSFEIKIAVRTIGDYLSRWSMTPQNLLNAQ